MSAAYMLGALAGGDDREALTSLQALVTADEECVRRACFHGLGIAGSIALPFLAELLKGQRRCWRSCSRQHRPTWTGSNR